jgi:hypothetical protein
MMHRNVLLLAFLVACSGVNKPTTPTGPSTGSNKISPANATYTTGEQVIEAALVAMGGRDKLSKLTAIKTTGSLDLSAMGMKGKVTIHAAPPRSSLTVIDIPGIGKIQQGTRDDLAWEFNPMQGGRIIKGPERATALREATFNGELQWKELYTKAELGGVVDFEGHKAYKVVLTAKDGGDIITRYYAQDTLLPIGFEAVVKSQMGEVPVKVYETDYREVNGIKFAHKIKRKDATDVEVTIDSIELGMAIDPSTFDPPEQVKALIK